MSVTLYHHTSLDGLRGIMSDGKIRESRVEGLDAVFGEGVYLTSLGPKIEEEVVAINNFENAAAAMLKEGRGKVIIEVTVPEQNVKKAKSQRDIFIHSGDIPKSNITSVYRRCNNGQIISCKFQSKGSKIKTAFATFVCIIAAVIFILCILAIIFLVLSIHKVDVNDELRSNPKLP